MISTLIGNNKGSTWIFEELTRILEVLIEDIVNRDVVLVFTGRNALIENKCCWDLLEFRIAF